MVRAIMMSPELISELVEMARQDEVLWTQLKDLELNQLDEDGRAKLPSGGMLVDDLVKRRFGSAHTYATGSLIVRLRYFIRIELGLPV
jgi:hypothetical protein